MGWSRCDRSLGLRGLWARPVESLMIQRCTGGACPKAAEAAAFTASPPLQWWVASAVSKRQFVA